MLHDSYFIKRNLILNLISHLGPISRTRLVALSDYRPASVTDIIKDLLEEKLIVETGSYSAGHGRKRVMLGMNKAYLCGLGMSFSADVVTFLVAQVDGVILKQTSMPIDRTQSREEMVEQISCQAAALLAEYPDKQMVGIGIGDPPHDPTGYERDRSLLVNYSHYNDWVYQLLKPRLETLTGLRVETYSGVTLSAVAEQRFGVAKGAQNFICVELSNGIGSSICCNGIPVAGNAGVAGELGHTVVDFDQGPQRLCYCGKPGCAESTTAYPALVAQLKKALDGGVFSTLRSEEITVESIRKAVEEGDRMCMHYVRQTARRLGVVISNAVNLLNPELVVLYGFMLELGDYFLKELESALRENVVPVAGDFAIRVSASQQTILPLGAVAEVFSEYLHSKDYQWVYQLQPGAEE